MASVLDVSSNLHASSVDNEATSSDSASVLLQNKSAPCLWLLSEVCVYTDNNGRKLQGFLQVRDTTWFISLGSAYVGSEENELELDRIWDGEMWECGCNVGAGIAWSVGVAIGLDLIELTRLEEWLGDGLNNIWR